MGEGEHGGVGREGKEAVTASRGDVGGPGVRERWGSLLSGWWDHRE